VNIFKFFISFFVFVLKMSKRARLAADDARRAGLHAWETPEGRRWLLKALNPNDVSVATAGIPTLQSRNISVLNWQGEYSVDVPANLSATNPAYDSTMFLYQHPLIFGMSASVPAGCQDMRDFGKYFQISHSGTDGALGTITLTSSSAPSKPISMTRCTQYLNNQIDPEVFNGDSSLAGRRKLFTQLTQKNRIIYGGATIIPTCSAENNSGSLAVCQQVFSPRKSVIETNTNIELNTYLASDFPDTSDLVQNPQMYYGRFQDGAYIPYKMHDPSNNLYVNSEQQIATRSPYFVKEITFIGTTVADADTPTKLAEVGVTYSAVSVNQFTATSKVQMARCVGVRFYIQTYTGLTGDERVIQAGIKAMEKYGSGCAGSRFLNGTLDLHVQLEKELAAFVGMDEAMCFATGFTVNSGVLGVLTDRHDFIICDDRDHASIVDGVRNSFSRCIKYKHNDMEELEKILQKCPADVVKLIVVDGVFSMEGDLAPLPKIVELKKKYPGTAIMVDEAHGLGVFGRQGRGVCDHFGLTKDVDLIMGTFSKSLASIGGFIAADSRIINYLRHHTRTYIFSASCTPAATASAREALHIIQEEPERIQKLWDVTNYALSRFREAGFEIGDTESPIIPLYVRDVDKTFAVTAMAYDAGVFINPVIPPACAPQDTLVRYALMATHTKEQVDESVEILLGVFRKLDIIK